jgi:hypothetical protein
MTKKIIKFVQTQLNAKGLNAGLADGIMGSRTLAALNQVEEIPPRWSMKRKVIAYIQLLALENNIEAGTIDGYWGPQTDYAYEVLHQVLVEKREPDIWRPEELPDVNPNDWPREKPEENLVQFYGEVGQNQAKINLPYPHRLAWDKSTVVNRFTCHEKVHDSLHRVLSRVLDNYGIDEIKRLHLDLWGGCSKVRKKRGGTTYSTQSWGIALDYDTERNQLHWDRNRANFAKPEYDTWWRLWEEEGWVSLGRTRNFDWMHIQATKI